MTLGKERRVSSGPTERVGQVAGFCLLLAAACSGTAGDDGSGLTDGAVAPPGLPASPASSDPGTLGPGADGLYRDHRGQVICDTSQEECAAFAPGAYAIVSPPMARLNRHQYDRTVRDVLGTELTPASRFPNDDTALGFDTISSIQRIQPEHVERYLAAAKDLAEEFVARVPGDPVWDRYVTCDLALGAECQRTALENLARQLWRRPLDPAEIVPFVELASAQPSAEEGLRTGLGALLLSSPFLFRIELDPNPADVTPHTLSAHELATRLSYVLWGTTPDAELQLAADSGALNTNEQLLAQVTRMITDPTRARSLVESFGAQWLNVNALEAVKPSTEQFLNFDDSLRAAMIAETKEFLWDFLSNDRPLPQLFNAEFTYLNARLAEHYEIPNVIGNEMRLVSTAGTNRVGLLTQGSFLTTTSNPTRTSPVKRGLFVLERLLCEAPPPPPPGVEADLAPEAEMPDLSVRERLLKHRQDGPTCFGCHQIMDPIGLSLENFDGVGTYRVEDEFGPIDASAELQIAGTQVAFDGASALAQLLATDSRTTGCVVEKVLQYGLGREIRPVDKALEIVVERVARSNGEGLRGVFEGLVFSDAFRKRSAAPAGEQL